MGWRCPSRDEERAIDAPPNRMSGGTELDSSRAMGPRGIAVTGTSIADAGLPSLKMSSELPIAVTGVRVGLMMVRSGEKASSAEARASGIVSFGNLLRCPCGACVLLGGESGGNISYGGVVGSSAGAATC